jgi:hypothetical protein
MSPVIDLVGLLSEPKDKVAREATQRLMKEAGEGNELRKQLGYTPERLDLLSVPLPLGVSSTLGDVN